MTSDERRKNAFCQPFVFDPRRWRQGQRFCLGDKERGIVLEVQAGRPEFKEDNLVLVVISSTDPNFRIEDPLRPFVFSSRQLYCREVLPNVYPVLRSYLEQCFR